MKSLLIGLGVLVVVLALGVIYVKADYGFQRLHPQGQIQEEAGWATYRLRAVCDTGNGTMVYIVSGMGNNPTVTLLPNGCARVRIQAEVER